MFLETFTAVQANFSKVFQTLFGGGECDLRLANPDEPLVDSNTILVAGSDDDLSRLAQET